MSDADAVNIKGVRRFTKYSGYLNSFACEGQVDNLDSNNSQGYIQSILTVDACYSNHFTTDMIERDLSKAFYTFREHKQATNDQYPVVSTGKWGCGVFGGLAPHKMVQQVLAANLSNVDLDFSCFGDMEGCDRVLAAMNEHKPTAAKIANLLLICRDRRDFVNDAIAYISEPTKPAATKHADHECAYLCDDKNKRNYSQYEKDIV
eukprot:15240952-Ditylum_brightwellii.AAC.1